MKLLINNRGFSLAEAVVGILILGILLVLVSGVFISGLASSSKTEKKVKNVILAECMMDNIMIMRYSHVKDGFFDGTVPDSPIPNPDGPPFPPAPYPFEIDPAGNETNYYYQVKSEYVGTSGTLRRITVTVISKGTDREPDTEATLECFKVN